MHEDTVKALDAINERLAKILEMIEPRQAELYKNPEAIAKADFFQPLQEALKDTQALMKKGQGELLDQVKTFHAAQSSKLAELRAKKAASAAAADVSHFRDSDHGLSKEAIDRLAAELVKDARARSAKDTSDWTNY